MKKKISLVILTAALALASAIGLAACGDEQNEPCAEHTWDGGKVTREATCAQAGETTYACTVCGATKTEEIAKSTTHAWDDGEVDQPDITVEGSITYTCTVCGDTYSESVPAHVEHEWDEGSQLKAPACSETGSMKYECEICHTTKTEEIPATGEHRFETLVGDATEPTCGTAGSATYKCLTCTKTETRTTPATGEHRFDTFVENVTDPTCVTAGSAIYQCLTCTETTTKEVAATGVHTLIWQREGNEHWQKCKNCVYVTEKEPHDGFWTEKDRQDADCANAGHIDYECKCGETKQEPIQSTGEHNFVLKETIVPATCGEAGSGVYECGGCHNTQTREIPPTGEHNYEAKFTNTQHYTECSVCHNETARENHSLDYVIETPATLFAAGVRHEACPDCEYEGNSESYELDNYVSDYRKGVVAENTSGWEYGHTDYAWGTPATDENGRKQGNPENNESFVFTKSAEFNGEAWLVKDKNNAVISEIKAGWLNGNWSTLAYTVGENVTNASDTVALGYRYTPAEAHKNLYTAANVRIAVLAQDGTCKYSEFIRLDGRGTNETREITGLNTGDKIYVFIELDEEKEKDGEGNVVNSSWSNGDFTCRIFEKQPERAEEQ